MVLAEYHIDFAYHGFALINALALAKVMILVQDLHLGEKIVQSATHLPNSPEVRTIHCRADVL